MVQAAEWVLSAAERAHDTVVTVQRARPAVADARYHAAHATVRRVLRYSPQRDLQRRGTDSFAVLRGDSVQDYIKAAVSHALEALKAMPSMYAANAEYAAGELQIDLIAARNSSFAARAALYGSFAARLRRLPTVERKFYIRPTPTFSREVIDDVFNSDRRRMDTLFGQIRAEIKTDLDRSSSLHSLAHFTANARALDPLRRAANTLSTLAKRLTAYPSTHAVAVLQAAKVMDRIVSAARVSAKLHGSDWQVPMEVRLAAHQTVSLMRKHGDALQADRTAASNVGDDEPAVELERANRLRAEWVRLINEAVAVEEREAAEVGTPRAVAGVHRVCFRFNTTDTTDPLNALAFGPLRPRYVPPEEAYEAWLEAKERINKASQRIADACGW